LLPQGPGTDTGACVFLSFCSTFRSGGTRIRTGDTMIFSSVAYFPLRIIVSVESAKVSHFLRTEA
jgi:hypothetical protein